MSSYFALRSYRDGGEHYSGQIGSESHPQEFLEALWTVMREAWRVLKPTGSCFINLGDRRSGSGGHNNGAYGVSGLHKDRPKSPTRDAGREHKATLRNAPDRYNQAAFGRPKSKMLLPHRFAIGCEDGLADPEGIGWIVRQDIVWSKPNGLPESVTDRTTDSHEFWFHLVKQGRYFSAVDEIRTPSEVVFTAPQNGTARHAAALEAGEGHHRYDVRTNNPLGKLPGSVWTVASEPLAVPEAVKAHYDLPDHFAAFPQEWPRRLILGWSPSGVCVACGEGRRPVVESVKVTSRPGYNVRDQRMPGRHATGNQGKEGRAGDYEATITGYTCACVTPPCDNESREGPGSSCRQAVSSTGSAGSTPGPFVLPPTRPAVVVDIFGGTGTVAGVARQLGRLGVSFDLSYDYCRLAQWFLDDGRRFAKTSSRTDAERQGCLL